MTTQEPIAVRRRILLFLYQSYQADPLHMLTPADFFEHGAFSRDELPANTHYLHERGLIELLVGYNPPLFAAARITPAGIDLVENEAEFNRRFPPVTAPPANHRAEIFALILRAAEQAQEAPLSPVRKNWILRDLQELRACLRKPSAAQTPQTLAHLLEDITHLTEGAPPIPAWDELKARLNAPE